MRKIIALLMALIVAAAIFVSIIYIGENLNHHCCGEDCSICMELSHKGMDVEKRATLDEMLFRFKAVKDAEDKKYVRMNAPKARLQEIIDVLPGLKSPTIIPLADDDWCSVHTVLDQKRFWEIIGKLKEMGAQGILVTPIEKMIL